MHTVGVKGDSTIEAVRKFHTTPDDPKTAVKEGNGWRDVGYHWFVRKCGTVQTGRHPATMGAHTEGANDTLGICVAGDGDVEAWTLAQLTSVVRLCAEQCASRGWTADVVRGHREAPGYFKGAKPTSKTCPGKMADLPIVRAFIQAELDEPMLRAVNGVGTR